MARLCVSELVDWVHVCVSEFGRPGSDLLSRVLRRSTIGAEGFHGRVRDGIGCLAPRHNHQIYMIELASDRLVFDAGHSPGLNAELSPGLLIDRDL
jgi:hypothetical protein